MYITLKLFHLNLVEKSFLTAEIFFCVLFVNQISHTVASWLRCWVAASQYKIYNLKVNITLSCKHRLDFG